MGPVAPFEASGYAVAPLSNRHIWVRSPDPWTAAPLGFVLDSQGDVRVEVGTLSRGQGRYLTWLENRAAVGARADTVLAFSFSSGMVTKFPVMEGTSVARASMTFGITRYFEAPEATEELITRTWIEEYGEDFVHVHVPFAETGTFAGDRLYAVVNYDAHWMPLDYPWLESDGVWEVERRVLEIYGLDGSRLASLWLPSGPIWIRADVNGRIFIGSGDSIVVARDPTQERPKCPTLPRQVAMPFDDPPPPRAGGVQ